MSCPALAATLVVVGLVAAAGCRGEQELRDDCPTAGGACPTCREDTECVIVSNECHAHAACTHRDRDPPLAVNMIGCNYEYDRPPAERCGCVDGTCRAR
jgi:hypothetical protein